GPGARGRDEAACPPDERGRGGGLLPPAPRPSPWAALRPPARRARGAPGSLLAVAAGRRARTVGGGAARQVRVDGHALGRGAAAGSRLLRDTRGGVCA